MADWRFKIDVADLFQRTKAGDATLQELSAEIARQLDGISKVAEMQADVDDLEIDDLASDFRDLAGDPKATADDFDSALTNLFDWGDTLLEPGWPTKRMCWVNVAFRKQEAA
jgi:hypothetical protein